MLSTYINMSIKVTMQLQSNDGLLNNDEILTFLYGRYVSAPEVIWRLNEFSLSEKFRVIRRLAVHLPNQQQVVKKKSSDNATSKFDAFKRPVQRLYNMTNSDKTTA
ncbi:hypothetical protein AVEN_130148-1 [Araneus ventricosus]|uniref:Uncharacterized protein n=1 Tax=Araneus ventricosus TaxID=182803 RepID=A0A4Y2QBA8_ARAVE|nr:hypothetical protein AVEN_130148-1 [Araneus ventricosus]